MKKIPLPVYTETARKFKKKTKTNDLQVNQIITGIFLLMNIAK